MSSDVALNNREMVVALKAAAEPTRLRILRLLSHGELNVTDLTRILGQSQPRLSRHLKLLVEAGLVDRFREGSWVYFHLSDRHGGGHLARSLLTALAASDPVGDRDLLRAQHLKDEREAAAQAYFQKHASDWDRIRALHVDEHDVEVAMRDALGPGPFGLFVDLGTGTGRMLEVFADRFERGLGIDVNQAMLAFARSNLSRAGITHAHVRHGDIYSVPIDNGAAQAVTMHQVLHFLRDPASAIREAARILAPGGRLLIVDFAPHELEFLRDVHAHVRLGLASGLVRDWLLEAGLGAGRHVALAPPEAGAADASGDGPSPATLTVSLWVAEKPGGVRGGRRNKSLAVEENA